MTRIAIIAVLLLPTLAGAEDYAPFDYSKTFERPAEEPEPKVEDRQPETQVLGPADIEAMSPPVEQPAPQKTFPESPASPAVPWPVEPPRPLVTHNTQDGRTQVICLTEAAWGDRDRYGRFTSPCVPCNTTGTGLVNMQRFTSNRYSVGEDESADFRVVDITSEWGHAIDEAMGADGHTLTELVGREDPAIRAYKSATPVFVIRYPDKPPQTIKGWTGGDPNSDAAAWWLLGMIGVRKDQPQTWAGLGEAADRSAIAWWVTNEPQFRGEGWGATLSLSEVDDLTKEGRHHLYGDVYFVVPHGCNPQPQIVNGRAIRIVFDELPYFEYTKGFLRGKLPLNHIEVEAGFRFNLVARSEGQVSRFPLRIQSER